MVGGHMQQTQAPPSSSSTHHTRASGGAYHNTQSAAMTGSAAANSATGSQRVSSRSRAQDEPHIGKYRLLKTIGKGNFAKGNHDFYLPISLNVSIYFPFQ